MHPWHLPFQAQAAVQCAIWATIMPDIEYVELIAQQHGSNIAQDIDCNDGETMQLSSDRGGELSQTNIPRTSSCIAVSCVKRSLMSNAM